jgi:hypothetical protein
VAPLGAVPGYVVKTWKIVRMTERPSGNEKGQWRANHYQSRYLSTVSEAPSSVIVGHRITELPCPSFG